MEIAAGLVWLLLPVLALAGVGWAIAARRPAALAIGAPLQAAGLALTTAVLVLYVASEDTYRADGSSRWDAYGAKPLTSAAVFVGLVAVVLLVVAWRARRRDLAVGGFLASTVAVVLQFCAVFANSLN